MKKIFLSFLLLSLFLGCDFFSTPEPDWETQVNIDQVIPDIPQELSGDDGAPDDGTRDLSQEQIDEIAAIYEPVLENYNPLAQDILDYINELLEGVQSSIFDNQEAFEELQSEGSIESTSTDNLTKILVNLESETYNIQMWNSISDQWVKILDVTLTGTDGSFVGTIYARESELESGETRLEALVEFDQSESSAEAWIQNLDYDDPDDEFDDDNIPVNLWISLQETEDEFWVSANIYYTQVDFSLIAETFRPYFLDKLAGFSGAQAPLTGNYIYRAALDLETGRTALDLALVTPEDTTVDGEVFDAYSMADYWISAIAGYMRSDPATGDTTLLTFINFFVETDVNTQSSDEEMIQALLDFQEATSSTDLDTLNFVLGLSNPVYYQDGVFAGTSEVTTPDWVAEAPDLSALPLESAASIVQLSIVMPSDIDPSF